MRKYFIVEGYQRKGPYTPEELKKFNITADTKIWTFENATEKPASEITELQYFFSSTDITDQIDYNNVSAINPNLIQNQKKEEQTEQLKDKQEEYLKIVEEQKKKYEEEQKLKQQEEQKKAEEFDNQLDEDTNKDSGFIPVDEPPKVATFIPENEQVPTNDNNIEPSEIANLVDLESQDKYHHTEYSSKNINAATNLSSFNKPKTYLALAIITTLMCCLPLGIVSIVFASQVETKFRAGDIKGAEAASKSALTFGIIALVSGIIFLLIVMLTNA
ncbi:MAG: CD225/dispanin family protein [Bacteroidales bacterium]|nr:CD225/dispanin family protein [Bacteroidales bacterium]